MAKYEAVKGYWVYSIKIPSVNKYYIGVSKQKCCNRWQKTRYKGMALEPYLDEWESMEKTVLVDNLSKKDAFIYEGNIIRALQMNNLCLNSNRSGLIEVSDVNAYMKQWHEDNPEYNKQYIENNPEYYKRKKEYIKQHQKQRYENDVEYREREKQRSKQYYENNKEKILERNKEKRLKKKLEQQNQQLNLFS